MREIFEGAGRELSREQEEKFLRFRELLLSYNEKINLTAITEPGEIAVKHFLDSLAGEKFIGENLTVVDVGSGAGFPAIPIMIMRDDLRFTLVDSLQKRVEFLKIAVESLGLRAECLHMRAEDAGKGELREKFDCAVARAVAPLNVLYEYALPLVKVGGKFVAYKGSDAKREADEAEKAVTTLGGRTEKIEEFRLPDGSKRGIVVIEKAFPTPKRYPRGQNKPRLSPL